MQESVKDRLKVRVVIPTRGKVGILRNCLASLFKTIDAQDVADVHVVVMEQGASGKAMIDAEFAARAELLWQPSEDGWSFSKINNTGAAWERSEHPYDFILLLNNDTVSKKGFLTAQLKAMAEHPDVGVCGAKLLFPQKTIQHIGVAFRGDGLPYHLGWGKPDDGTYAPADRDDYYDAVTFACVLIRSQVWDEVGGLDEAYHFNYEDIDFCLKAREKGWRSFIPCEAVLIHLESQSSEARQTTQHSVQRNLQILRDRWIMSGKADKLLSIRIDKKVAALRDDRMNILMIPSARYAGVPWWRMTLPAQKIAKKGLANIVSLYPGEDEKRFMQLVDKCHVLATQGFWSDWVWRLAALGGRRGFGMVYDYDDHPIYISPYAQAYRTFGVKEFYLTSGNGDKVWLWRDGENGFDVERNKENRQRQVEIFHLVDMVTTTTPRLSKYFQTLNKNVTILPNSIDFDIWKPMDGLFERRSGPVRIGWHGGDNHFHDIMAIGEQLVRFVNTHDVRLVLFGAYYRGALKSLDPNKVEEHEWTHVDAFPYKLASLGIDVGIVPLADPTAPEMEFGAFKSNIKWLEYSALKIPAVVVNADPYSDCVDGETALVYNTPDEFEEKLARLCGDAPLRKRLAMRANAFIHDKYDLDKNCEKWVEAYASVARNFGEAPAVEVPLEPEEEADRLAGGNAVSEGSVVPFPTVAQAAVAR